MVSARSIAGVLAVSVLGCGPSVATPSGEGTATGDQTAGSTGSTGSTGGSSTTAASTLDPSSGSSTSGSEPLGLCFETHALEQSLFIFGYGVADFDVDGRAEIWSTDVVRPGVWSVDVFTYQGDGAMELRAQWSASDRMISVADVDHDGLNDAVFRDDSDQLYARSVMNDALDLDTNVLALGLPTRDPLLWDDVNGDGRVDVFLEEPGGKEAGLRVWLASGPGSFEPGVVPLPLEPYTSPEAVRRSGPSEFTVQVRSGGIGFFDYQILTVTIDADGEMMTIGSLPWEQWTVVEARDRSGDGRPDLVLKGFGGEPSFAMSGPTEDYEILELSEYRGDSVSGRFVEPARHDILVQTDGESFELWSGSPIPTDLTEAVIGTVELSGAVAADLDGDGLDELLHPGDPASVTKVVRCPL